MNIYEKLSLVQNELKAPKNQYNSFGKFNYRSCEDILTAVKPIAAKHKVVVYLTDQINNIGDRYYIEVTAHFVDCEKENQRITVTASAREDETKKGMDDSQITGSASSYARKYALNGLFNIDDTKDADTDEYQKQNGNKKAENKPSAMICPECGKEITSAEIGGKTYQAASIFKKYGTCYNCHVEKRKKEREAKKND